MDRRRSSRSGRRAVHDPVHAAQGAKHLEQREREACGRAHRGRANARSGSRHIRQTSRRAFGDLLVRARSHELDAAATKALKADRAALAFHEKQPPAYRRLVAHWVMRAKKPETRARRLQVLIANAREGKRIPSQA